ncbi:hypothetical protein UFOVP411_23 [uncultured Caudovirales phage]|uniref:Uncharacterized protein n=1 Tax=uncultured Caudovirales phage TaxID=2100421 RepID=A0A6J5M2Q2_9CAUD|nr:hypothetical protein UFOVP411_23 [uncultured Caudovirales phage]
MKASSAKAKGRRLQQQVAADIRSAFGLPERDVVSTSMGAQGADVKLSAKAFRLCPLAVECKNVAAFVGYTYWEQAKAHAKTDGGLPVAVVKANRKGTLLVVLEWPEFLTLLKEAKHGKPKETP